MISLHAQQITACYYKENTLLICSLISAEAAFFNNFRI